MKDRIVFLCTGNICRSPLAEALARQMCSGLALEFVSAGLNAVVGLPASTFSVQYAAAQDASLVDHRSQPITPDLLAPTSWVIGMTRSHAAIFRSRYGGVFTGAVGILAAAGVDLTRQTYSPDSEEVDDPYGMTEQRYAACGDQIHRLLLEWRPTFTNLCGNPADGSRPEDM